MRILLVLLAISLVAISSPSLAGPHCTDEPQSKWLTEADMMERIKAMGHQIDVFKTTKGNCYEIYGRDKSGRRIEIYFHPVTGDVVKSSVL